MGAYSVTLLSVDRVQGPNYISDMGQVVLAQDGAEVARINPERRFYPVAAMPTTEAGIMNGIFADVYVVIGEPLEDGRWAIRTYVKPFANWIWGGGLLMAFGGCLSLSDRRYRVAAGVRRRSRQAVPAE